MCPVTVLQLSCIVYLPILSPVKLLWRCLLMATQNLSLGSTVLVLGPTRISCRVLPLFFVVLKDPSRNVSMFRLGPAQSLWASCIWRLGFWRIQVRLTTFLSIPMRNPSCVLQLYYFGLQSWIEPLKFFRHLFSSFWCHTVALLGPAVLTWVLLYSFVVKGEVPQCLSFCSTWSWSPSLSQGVVRGSALSFGWRFFRFLSCS